MQVENRGFRASCAARLAARLAGTPKVEQYRTKYGKNSLQPGDRGVK